MASTETLRSRVRIVFLAALCAATVPSLAAQERPVSDAPVVRGTLSFDGRATAGDFVGSTETVSGKMTGRSLAEVKGFVEAPVNTLLTGNDRRDRDLNKSMESEKHPTLRFALEAVRPLWERGDSAGVVLVGTLTLHGVPLPRELQASLAWEADQIRLQTTFPVNLEDHKIGGLSKMFGVLKMYPDIDVHVDLVFGPVARTAPDEASDTLGRPDPPAGLADAWDRLPRGIGSAGRHGWQWNQSARGRPGTPGARRPTLS